MSKVKTKMMLYPFLITMVGTVLMMIMLLMPYASAKGDHKEYLVKYGEYMYVDEIKMTNADAIDISLYEFLRIYAEVAEQGVHKEISIACIVIIAIFAVFSAFTFFMTLIKRPIGIIIFDLLALVAFRIIHFDFEDRGVIPGSLYDWGIASYMTYVIGMVIIVGAVWMFVEKRRAKKSDKVELNIEVQE